MVFVPTNQVLQELRMTFFIWRVYVSLHTVINQDGFGDPMRALLKFWHSQIYQSGALRMARAVGFAKEYENLEM